MAFGKICRTKRYNVIASGRRDHYQLAVALNEGGSLGYLVTDFYTPRFFKRLFPRRWTNGLPSSRTISIVVLPILSKILRPGKFNKLRVKLVHNVFGFLAGAITYCTCNRAVVYSYHLVGFLKFYRLISKAPDDLVCFLMHPTPWYVNKLIRSDSEAFSNVRPASFEEDIEGSFTDKDIHEFAAALRQCRLILCASTTVERSLRPNVVPQSVQVVPYGSWVNMPPSRANHYSRAADQRIRLLSVCQMAQRKGLHWAFEAMAALPPTLRARYEWHVVWNTIYDKQVASLAPENVTFSSGLSNEDIRALMEKADLFVMPSILEGFGLVYLEALSLGTPIVYTANTGPDDFCEHGKHGFRVHVSNLMDLLRLFQAVAEGTIDLPSLRLECTRLGRELTWEKFRAGIRGAVTDQSV